MVKNTFDRNKKSNPAYRLGDAMRDAKKVYSKTIGKRVGKIFKGPKKTGKRKGKKVGKKTGKRKGKRSSRRTRKYRGGDIMGRNETTGEEYRPTTVPPEPSSSLTPPQDRNLGSN